ncbi:MAG: type VI secretion system baseplate subunit TssG [Pirellulales bacterium]
MAVANGRAGTAVIQRLFREPYRFDFFQAVRLLDSHARGEAENRRRWPVGYDATPVQEIVWFRAPPSLSFPAGSIVNLTVHDGEGADRRTPPEMTVPFLGLTGPSAVLPQHYTSLLIERCHVKNKDYALREYFDLFHHRLISLFYRAWEKYHFQFAFERVQLERPGEDDGFTFALYSLVGLGVDGLRRRMAFDDEAVLFYGGYFAHFPRNAISLECLLGDYWEIPVTVQQFRGQWLYLSEEEQTALPSAERPLGRNCALGVDAIVGTRVWNVQSMFRIRIGPVTYPEFKEFMPVGRRLLPLCEMTRLYAGIEFDFDVQVVLKKEEVPWCQLPADPTAAPRLGWNSWVRSVPMQQDADEAVFRLENV